MELGLRLELGIGIGIGLGLGSVRRHRSAMLPLGPSSESTPDRGGGLRARCTAYLGRVRVRV